MCSIGKWNGSQAQWALLDSAAMLPKDWGRESGASSAWQSPPPANVHIQTNARIQITKYKGKEMLVICLMDLWKTKIRVDVAITRYIVWYQYVYYVLEYAHMYIL